MKKYVMPFVLTQLQLILLFAAVSCSNLKPADANMESRRAASADIYVNSIGMKLRYIRAGEFLMGTSLSTAEISARYGGKEQWYEAELPRHKVTLSKGFWIGVCEVTREQFMKFVLQSDYKTTAEQIGSAYGMSQEGWGLIDGISWRNPGIEQADGHPVVQISWHDALAFCKWLSDKEKKYYTLPTEAQWEYACRAGTQTEYSWSDDALDGLGYANMCDESANNWMKTYNRRFGSYLKADDHYIHTAPVGTFKPNDFGLYDMHGNAWEWCLDWYGKYDSEAKTDPKGPENGEVGVLRGGGWRSRPNISRSSFRYKLPHDSRTCVTGFRVILED